MNHDGRGLSERDIERIQRDFMNGLYNDQDLHRIFETVLLQRRVLREIFNHFQSPMLKRYSFVEALPNSQLAHWKELVNMEEKR